MALTRGVVVGDERRSLFPPNPVRILGWLRRCMESVEPPRTSDVAQHRDDVRRPIDGGVVGSRGAPWSRFEPRDVLALVALLIVGLYCLVYKTDPASSGCMMLLLGWIIRASVNGKGR